MIPTPKFVADALKARHPNVACVYSLQFRLFRLQAFWGGSWKHLRWIERRTPEMPAHERGEFIWPDLWNTVEWLNQTDTWGKAGNDMQLRMLQEHMLNRPTARKKAIQRAKLSDMVRYGMAPELMHAMKKDLR